MADLPRPVSNTEVYLAYLSGQNVELPRPVTREEEYLYYLCVNGGGGGGSGGTKDYNMLNNHPSINGVELAGNKTSEDLGIDNIKEIDIPTLRTTWSLQHNLQTPWYMLTTTFIDSDNNIVIGDVDVDKCTDNLLVINFREKRKGKAIIKK